MKKEPINCSKLNFELKNAPMMASGRMDGGSNTLNLLVNFLTEVECSNSGDDYQTHLDFSNFINFAIESSDW